VLTVFGRCRAAQIRVWDVFERQAATEALPHTTDVLAFAFHPSGNEICVATLGTPNIRHTGNARQTGARSNDGCQLTGATNLTAKGWGATYCDTGSMLSLQ
jgi:hypothetical protein